MNPNQLDILQHSLGCNEYGIAEHRYPRDEPYYRNRYVSNPDADLIALVETGYLKDHGIRELWGNMNCYTVTDKGIAAMRAESPKPPKISRSKQRYLDFLRADLGCSFAEYLKNGWYKPIKNS
jgi:hypothetical protein